MERRLSLSEDGGDRVELSELLRAEDPPDGVHVSGEAGHRQETPAMASRNVLRASVLLVDVVEGNPARQVGHGLGPGPVREVLVPGDDASDAGRLHEDLVVPEAHRSPQKLACGNEDCWIPEQIVERNGDPPGAESVKDNAAGLPGLVRMPFVEEVRSGMLCVQKRLERVAKELYLIVVEARTPARNPSL
jgi:hypothetical protein